MFNMFKNKKNVLVWMVLFSMAMLLQIVIALIQKNNMECLIAAGIWVLGLILFRWCYMQVPLHGPTDDVTND